MNQHGQTPSEMVEIIRELREALDCYNAVIGLTGILTNKDAVQEMYDRANKLLTKTEGFR